MWVTSARAVAFAWSLAVLDVADDASTVGVTVRDADVAAPSPSAAGAVPALPADAVVAATVNGDVRQFHVAG